MLVAAAACPCPPLLVPEVAAGAAAELDAVRTACTEAMGVLAASRPDRLVVVGPTGRDGRGGGSHPQGTPGSFRGFGVALDVWLGEAPGGAPAPSGELPPSLAVAAWMLERLGWSEAPLGGFGVDERLEPARCLDLGREIAVSAGRVALLTMGDGSACRTVKAPGYYDERAEGFDAAAARALGTADVAALAALDAGLAYELQASGRAPWQVLAGAAEGAALSGTLVREEAPYGVDYLVAAWS